MHWADSSLGMPQPGLQVRKLLLEALFESPHCGIGVAVAAHTGRGRRAACQCRMRRWVISGAPVGPRGWRGGSTRPPLFVRRMGNQRRFLQRAAPG